MLDISTPAIWYPGQSDEEEQEEIQSMMLRANATQAFLKGEIDADFFLNFLHELGLDVFSVSEEWNLGDGIIV